jgi:hypothetical protein
VNDVEESTELRGHDLVRYTGDPADPNAKKHIVEKVYGDEQEANIAAMKQARTSKERTP